MLGSPRIVAFDNEKKDLDALVQGINRAGATCLGFQYTGKVDDMGVGPCPYVRVVFFDLNILDAAASADFSQNYSIIGDLLGRLEPKGPYLLVLWTHYEDKDKELQEFLNERLDGVTKPFSVAALAKERYLDDDAKITNIDDLVTGIRCITQDSPALLALLDWEDRVFLAASEALSSTTMLGETSKSSEEQQRDIPRLMTAMSVAAAGHPNVRSNPLRAMSDALMPVLSDHVLSMPLDNLTAKAWKNALDLSYSSISENESAQLNTAIHIAKDIGKLRGGERGAVIPLCTTLRNLNLEFKEQFGIDEFKAALYQFQCEDLKEANARWVLVQSQAACDYAQRQPGPLPFCLGLDMSRSVFDSSSAPAALWRSPGFQMEGELRELRVNFRFHMSLAVQKAKGVEPIYRLREQVLGDLGHALHTYGSRPGMISLRSDD